MGRDRHCKRLPFFAAGGREGADAVEAEVAFGVAGATVGEQVAAATEGEEGARFDGAGGVPAGVIAVGEGERRGGGDGLVDDRQQVFLRGAFGGRAMGTLGSGGNELGRGIGGAVEVAQPGSEQCFGLVGSDGIAERGENCGIDGQEIAGPAVQVGECGDEGERGPDGGCGFDRQGGGFGRGKG